MTPAPNPSKKHQDKVATFTDQLTTDFVLSWHLNWFQSLYFNTTFLSSERIQTNMTTKQ